MRCVCIAVHLRIVVWCASNTYEFVRYRFLQRRIQFGSNVALAATAVAAAVVVVSRSGES